MVGWVEEEWREDGGVVMGVEKGWEVCGGS